ncbi:DUF305 domain-containing protein [Planomonospora corallina]|uniref:DUF305 domain-containing protein n=1 Tax=Planomonospora corallina TaxID=1806052 RepID=A0ABV8I488_9ACTN
MSITRSAVRRLALTAVTAAGAMTVLTACGGDSGPMTGAHGMTGGTPAPAATAAAPQPSATFNDADVMFAQMMIPHHEQAVEMSELAATRAADPEVKELAQKIQGAQDPEITTMTGWLRAWGEATVPQGGHAGHGMPGMMTEGDLAMLEEAEGAEFDRMFSQMMISHHKGAVEMARTEQAQGLNPEAVRLARTIETAQQAEIEQMNKILARL